MGSEGCDSSSPVSSCPVLSCVQGSHPTSAPCPRQLQPHSLSQHGQGWAWEHLHKLQAMEHHICPIRLDFGEGQLGACLVNQEEPFCFGGWRQNTSSMQNTSSSNRWWV